MTVLDGLRPCLVFALSFVESVLIPVAFNRSLDQCEGKWDEKTENQPEVNHLGVGRWRELRYFTRENGRHHQHDCEVDRLTPLEKNLLVKGGGIADGQEEQGGQVGGEHLHLDLPLEGHDHMHLVHPLFKPQVCYCEHDQVFVGGMQLLEVFGLTVFVHHQRLLLEYK